VAKVKLVNVTKKFGRTTAINNLSLEIKDREFFVVAGPPGVGKTTFLRVIAGLEKPDEGEVYIGDELVNEVDPKDRDISIVFENLALYPNKTAFENIAFYLEEHKTPKEEIRKRVMEVARMLLIEHLLDRTPGTYSGGERQRVALARAIIRRPRVYLLDQPLANLDAKIRESMRAELKRLAKELGQTIIFTTHDQFEAMSMGDRIAVLNMGEIQQCSTPGEVYNHPANRFVANFVGSPSMNFLDCSYEEKDGKAYLVHEAFNYDVTEFRDRIAKEASGMELTLGIRPVDIRVVDKPALEGVIEAKVFVTEPLGSRSIVTLQVGKDLVKAIVRAGFEGRIGDKKYVEFGGQKIHIFDRKTERAIV